MDIYWTLWYNLIETSTIVDELQSDILSLKGAKKSLYNELVEK